MSRLAAVLWDIDGTLVDSEPTHERALADVLASFGAELRPQTRQLLLGTSIAETHAILAALHPALPDLAGFAAAKNAAYLARAREFGLRTGVREALDWLAAEGVRCGFVSNSDRVIVDANLRAAGLDAARLVTVARDDVARGKPHPDPYLAAAQRLNVAPSACLVIEDSPLGAAAGVAAGMTVIGWPAAPGAAFPAEALLCDPLDIVGALRLSSERCRRIR